VRLLILQFAICNLQFAISNSVFADDSSLPAREEATLNAAVNKVAPSIVQIRTIGGLDVVDGTVLADGPTTGLVVSADGYIVSSAFNFAQQPSSILITFPNGKQAPAELIATDHSRMLVLLKANGMADLPVPEMAPVDEIRPGEWAVAVGRTFRADRTNVTVGIVSAINRMFGKAIQTDADVSTANYGGPLVDIRGRVLGVIVPMSPQATTDVAGTEWYDSGIGFAVPLAPIAERIEHMKKGESQRAGLLGIGMQPKNPHSAAAELAAVRPDSPAGLAGLKKGDKIVEVNGKQIRSQTDLRFALGTEYGGDTVDVIAQRGEERLERKIKLVGELAAFRHAFLGILPLRPLTDSQGKANARSKPAENAAGKKSDGAAPSAEGAPDSDDSPTTKSDSENPDTTSDSASSPGVIVRMVYPESPAAAAGVQNGDRIVNINDTKVKTIDDAIQALNNVAPTAKVSLRLIRDDKAIDVELSAAELPTSIPAELPPAFETRDAASQPAKAAGETTELKLPEFPHTCSVYVPATRAAGESLGALLWLVSPSESKPDETIHQWQKICDQTGLVLIVPTPKDADHWERTDAEYLHRVLERVLSQYKIDPHRVVIGGQGNTGSIAWPIAFAGREFVRGIAVAHAPLPRQTKILPNDPAQRLAVFAAIPPKKDVAASLTQGLKRIAEAGYNLSTITTSTTTGQFSDAEREELARWIDTLDRF
jgi:serine protease Do